ncbi:hypothetical protein IQ07DRAFT_419344 [Pyrenochaeta sp. DS3sAY3a]|nr:hypothetical protein IQ07DRAFT_419344 [Pyrenochaeta sp. DS3sAY3a]
MNPQYQSTPDSALPQVIPQEHSAYLYPASDRSPASDQSPALSILQQKQEYHVQHTETPLPSKPLSRKWTAWPLLIVYGVVLAVLAGIIGGFIGQTIERNAHSNNTSLPSNNQAEVSGSSPTPTSATPSPSSTPSPNERTITIPSTGCNPTTQRATLAGRSTFLQASYTTICATGWLLDELIGISVATPSDCIEACVQYNAFKRSMGRPDSERNCIGGGFIPEWVNQRQAVRENPSSPFNCYLKNGTSGVMRNDRGIEVVALCLEGQCGSVLG